MAPQNKIAHHPEREKIIAWLTQGVSVRDVEARLREMFPDEGDEHLRVSFSALQVFRKDFLNIEDRVLDDLKEATALTRETIRKEAIQAQVEGTSAYKEKINSIVDEQLQVQREIVKTFTLIESRIETLFNRAQDLKFTDHKLERLLQGYFDQILKIVESYKKFIEGYKDTTDVNVNINIATSHINVMREVVREVLADVDPQLAISFMDKLNKRLREMTPLDQDADGVLLDHRSNT